MQYVIKGGNNEGIQAKVLSTQVLLSIKKIHMTLHFSFFRFTVIDLIKILAVHQ